MAGPSEIDYEKLTEDGFVVLRDLIDDARLEAFEEKVDVLGAAACRRLGIEPEAGEPFIDLTRRGGEYWSQFYELLERLFVLEQMNVDVGEFLQESGFLDWAEFEAPVIWPDVRADPPDDETLLLRVHQDFASTRCHRAWRLWVPLRRADEHHGSMRVFAGTHSSGLLPHSMDDPRYPEVPREHWEDARSVVLELPAGDGVLFHPLLLHESVPNRSDRMKFTLLLQVQDLTTVCHPEDPDEPMGEFLELTERRAEARAAEGTPTFADTSG